MSCFEEATEDSHVYQKEIHKHSIYHHKNEVQVHCRSAQQNTDLNCTL